MKNFEDTKKQYGMWHKLFFGARTQILAWYVVLMAFSALVSIFLIRHILSVRVEERVEKSLILEVREMRGMVQEKKLEASQQSDYDVITLFDQFLSRNIPSDDEFFITFVNGQFYKSSPEALPIPLQPNSVLIQSWAQARQPQQGEIVTSVGKILYFVEPIKIRYRVEPIKTQAGNQAVFVVANITSGEHKEVDEAVVVVVQVTLTVLVIASVLAWIAAGRVLAPLRLLTETARSIRESDLNQRIVVKGSDQIAELAITFNEMLDRLQAAFRCQREFINDAGHELRTPITIIRGHLELMGDNPQEQRETLELATHPI